MLDHNNIYKANDIIMDLSEALYGYENLLKQNGFYYYSSFKDTSGRDVLVYRNSSYEIYLSLGVMYFSGIPCIAVMIS